MWPSPSTRCSNVLPSFGLFLESLMGDTHVSAEMPADFEEMHRYSDHHGWQRTFRFMGKDNKVRHLSVTILNHGDKVHSLTFGVLGRHPTDNDPGDEDPDVVAERLNSHGRGPDVMSAVTHVLKKHIDEHDPETINFAPTTPSRGRLYQSLFRRIAKGGHWQDGNKFHKWPAF